MVMPVSPEPQAGLRQQGLHDHIFPALGPAAGELRHQGVGVAVHHHTRQAVGLAMDQADTVALYIKTGPGPYRAVYTRYEKRSIDAFVFIKAPDPGAYLRARTERGPAEKLAFVAFHTHGFAGIAAAFGNCAVKHPGVAPQQRTLLAWPQSNGFHAAIVAGLQVSYIPLCRFATIPRWVCAAFQHILPIPPPC
jgi:hypothetical protein